MKKIKKIITWWDHRNAATDIVLDTILDSCIDSGIEECYHEQNDLFEGYCKFKNGYVYRYWDRNKPYAWLIRGKFLQDEKLIYFYDGGMPSKKTMNKFNNAICEYFIKKASV